ncbi:HAD family phosphatase [Pararhizobium sp. IMCC21322]|uniref:HAD family hydrolase n=1 Tax=Pararhizobium sp. IMCC21322 TaxID=3067903 RepID=UPI0027421183|nr:HAD family phosphatase [Pararhizobium sp. IMCC21322]
MKNIVFDIGNVLIAWDAHAAFREAFPDDATIDRFFAEVGFYEWNLEQDRGRSRLEAVAAMSVTWPEHAPLLDQFFDRFPDTIQKKISGSWQVLDDLKISGHRIFGLTNWGAETWPMTKQVHPELNNIFEDVVVSGHEKLIKPDRRIYEVLTVRNNLRPDECLFIDDSPKNVEGAQIAGWQALHFTGPDELRKSLKEMGLL